MSDEFDVDEQLRKLKKESDQEFKKIVNRGGLVMVAFSLVLASAFFYIFYLSPKRSVDIAVVVTAIIISVALFALGLKRYFE